MSANRVRAVPVAGAADKKQGWDRKAYNAYQRELMKKRRAKAK
jgi:hypothetical protein